MTDWEAIDRLRAERRHAYQAKEAALLLGVPYRTVMGLIHRGELGHVPAGRYYLVPHEEIVRFLKRGTKTSA